MGWLNFDSRLKGGGRSKKGSASKADEPSAAYPNVLPQQEDEEDLGPSFERHDLRAQLGDASEGNAFSVGSPNGMVEDAAPAAAAQESEQEPASVNAASSSSAYDEVDEVDEVDDYAYDDLPTARSDTPSDRALIARPNDHVRYLLVATGLGLVVVFALVFLSPKEGAVRAPRASKATPHSGGNVSNSPSVSQPGLLIADAARSNMTAAWNERWNSIHSDLPAIRRVQLGEILAAPASAGSFAGAALNPTALANPAPIKPPPNSPPTYPDDASLAVSPVASLLAPAAHARSSGSFRLSQGTSMACVMDMTISNAQPGLATCRLSHDVYSDTEEVLLLEKDSRVIGQFMHSELKGGDRMLVIWTRVKTPSGVMLDLDPQPADGAGRAAASGAADAQFFERFGQAVWVSLVQDVTTSAAFNTSGPADTVNAGGVVVGGGAIVQHMLHEPGAAHPSLSKSQGDVVNIIVARDLDFAKAYALRQERSAVAAAAGFKQR